MTTHYMRAYAERTDGDGPIRFVAATEGVKGDGLNLLVSDEAVDLSRYQANPVFLWAHDYRSAPIGKGRAFIEDGKVKLDVTFDRNDDFAAKIERKYRGGFLSAVSVGFDIDSDSLTKRSDGTGWDVHRWTLNEVSAVPVPMDPDALMETQRHAMRTLGSQLLELVGAPEVSRASATKLLRALEPVWPQRPRRTVSRSDASKLLRALEPPWDHPARRRGAS